MKRIDGDHRLFMVAFVVSLALCPIGCVEMFMGWATIWDGPGIGLFSLGPDEMLLFPLAWVLAQKMWRRSRVEEQRPAIFAAALVCIAFVALDMPRKLYAASWSARCHGGEPRTCFAAGDLFLHGLGVDRDEARATELFRHGCDRGDFISCARIFGRARGDVIACARLREQCEAMPSPLKRLACEIHDEHCPDSPTQK